MTFFYKFGKKARVYYTLSISRGGGPGPRGPPPGFATGYSVEVNLNFNATKSFCVAFIPKLYKLSLPPLFMNTSRIYSFQDTSCI